MSDMLLNLINYNEGVNYNTIFVLVFLYMFLFWFIVCVWVFFDGSKRYDNKMLPLLTFLFVLLMGFPALVFYILIRPEHTKEEKYFIEKAAEGKSVESEKIHITGGDGFNVMLNFEVFPNKGEEGHELKVGMDWVPAYKQKDQFVGRKKRSVGVIDRSVKKAQGLLASIGKELKRISNSSKTKKVNKKKDKKNSDEKNKKGFKKDSGNKESNQKK